MTPPVHHRVAFALLSAATLMPAVGLADPRPAPIRLAQASLPPAAPNAAPPQVASPQAAYLQDPLAVARINAQIDAMLSAPNGGFAVQYYAKPAPPVQPAGLPPTGYGGPAGVYGGPPALPPGAVARDREGHAQRYVIARAGDTVYATLDRGFNSDDPQAPIFATIRDVDRAGLQGPLDNVRLIGAIVYSAKQATIQFQQGFLPDGRPLPVKAMAISEDTARSGIAKDVETHDFERYGSLVAAALIQGAGQVGQLLLQNNQQVAIDPATGLAIASQRVAPYQAALGGVLPLGQALTATAAQNFNKPATISSPTGSGIGLVFLDNVAVPRDHLLARLR